MLSLLSISAIISPISDIATERARGKKKKANGKERANKTARVKWGEENERQMANNINVREMSL